MQLNFKNASVFLKKMQDEQLNIVANAGFAP